MPSISLPASLVAEGLTGLGIGAETAGIAAPILTGAGIGALTDLKNPLMGAAGGAITGGFGELAGPLAGATGIGSGAAGALTGAAGGALGGLVSGQGAGVGALMGGVEGGLGALNGPAKPAGTPSGGTSAAAATPTGLNTGGASPDLTGGGGGSLFDRIGGALGLSGSGGGGGPQPVSISPPVPGSGASGVGSTPGATFPSPGPSAGAPSGGLLDQLGIKSNQILPLVGTAAAALRGPPGDLKQLEGMARGFAREGTALSSAINTGILPPGLEAALHSATQSADANIKGTYANLGLSGSTMEAQALNADHERASAQAFSYARDLLQSGLQESGLSAQLFSSIMASNEAADQSLTNAIGAFAGASQGGTTPAGWRPAA